MQFWTPLFNESLLLHPTSPSCVGHVLEPIRQPCFGTHSTARAEQEERGWAVQGGQEGKERASEREMGKKEKLNGLEGQRQCEWVKRP